MKKVITFFFFVSLLVINSFPSIVSACSCAELPSVKEEVERSDAVFSGMVLDIREKRNASKSVLFEVRNIWKGADESQIIITTGQGGGDCGFIFKEGTEYLVYASESTLFGEKSLASSICDRTNKMTSLQEDITILGDGQPPTKEVDLTREHAGSNLYIWVTVAAVMGIMAVVILIIKNRGKSR